MAECSLLAGGLAWRLMHQRSQLRKLKRPSSSIEIQFASHCGVNWLCPYVMLEISHDVWKCVSDQVNGKPVTLVRHTYHTNTDMI